MTALAGLAALAREWSPHVRVRYHPDVTQHILDEDWPAGTILVEDPGLPPRVIKVEEMPHSTLVPRP